MCLCGARLVLPAWGCAGRLVSGCLGLVGRGSGDALLVGCGGGDVLVQLVGEDAEGDVVVAEGGAAFVPQSCFEVAVDGLGVLASPEQGAELWV